MFRKPISNALVCLKRGARNVAGLLLMLGSAYGQEARLSDYDDLGLLVYSDQLSVREAIGSVAQNLDDQLTLLLGKGSGRSMLGIVVETHASLSAGKPQIQKRFYAVGGKYRLQIELSLEEGLKRPLIEKELLRGLLLRRVIGKKETFKEGAAIDFPEWLLEGFLEAINWKKGQSDYRIYEALFSSGMLLSIEDLLKEGDESLGYSTGKVAYRASTGALVMTLLAQKGAQASFREYLIRRVNYEGEEMDLLMASFPELNLSEKSLAKWWLLQMAKLSEIPLMQSYSLAETEKLLAQAVTVRFEHEGELFQISPEEYLELGQLPVQSVRPAVLEAQLELSNLYLKAFPPYRSIVKAYFEAMGEVRSLKEAEKWNQNRLEMEKFRETSIERQQKLENYLDWFQITSNQEVSGNFDDYIRLKDELNTSNQAQKRRSEIERYMDSIQQMFHRK